MIKHIFALFPGFIFMLLFSSCNKDNTFTLGQQLVDVKTDVITTDTATIKFYTFKRDSISSNVSKLLVGSYSDGNFGTINASSFFEVGLPSTASIQSLQSLQASNPPVYDSITLTAFYSHYYYGDTTKPYNIEVHRLTDRIGNHRYYTNNPYGYLFNNSKVPYDPQSLGSASKVLRPSKKDSIQIRLSDGLGLELFDTIKNAAGQLSTGDNFLNYLKGFVLLPENPSSCVMGFTDSVFMRIYYHGQGKNFLTFNLSSADLQFNHIESSWDVANPMSSLSKQVNVVSSFKTNHQTYCQAGTGIMTRLEFPYLKKLLETSTNTTSPNANIKILKAELVLCPVQGTYNSISLPTSLNLYQLDDLNNLVGVLTNSQGQTLTPSLTIDYQFNEQTQYTFDVTSFVTGAIQQTSNEIPALGVSLTSDVNNTTFDRVILGDGSRQVNVSKLRILFWRY